MNRRTIFFLSVFVLLPSFCTPPAFALPIPIPTKPQAVGASYGTKSYRYDPIGNLTNKEGVSYAYGAGGVRPHGVISGSDGSSFSYDAAGNMTVRGGQRLTWDLENRLAEVVAPARIYGVFASGGPMSATGRLRAVLVEPGDGEMTGATRQLVLGWLASLGEPPVSAPERRIRFEYDFAGQRVRQVTPEATTTYVGDLYEVASSSTGGGSSSSGRVATKHIWLNGRRVASVSVRPATSVRAEPVEARTEILFYHPDHLGSTSVVTDSTGAVVQRLEYFPFGSVNSNTGAKNVAYKHTGKPLDDETGLMYFGARYYDAHAGRWISPDPTIPDMFNPQHLNRYSYVNNNPMNLIDPDGYAAEEAQGSWGGVADQFNQGDVAGAAQAVFETIGAAFTGHDLGRSNSGPGAGAARANASSVAALSATLSGGDPAHAADRAVTSGTAAGQSSTGSPVAPGTPGKPPPFDSLLKWLDRVSWGLFAGDLLLGGPTGEGIGPASLLQALKQALRKGGLSLLRRRYESAVRSLALKAERLRVSGMNSEQIARILYAERRAIGAKFKARTPPELREKIFERNLQKYGDPYGPSIEWLQKVKGKSWDEIIESASKTGGQDLGF